MPDEDKDALKRGSLLHGEYYIEACLGRGGFGITYRAFWKGGLVQRVAIKELFPRECRRDGNQLKPGGSWTPEELEEWKARFLSEGRILAKLQHPGIVTVYYNFAQNGTAYLVMELIDGQTLEKYRTACGGQLPAEEALHLTRDAGGALEYVHAAGLLHRDLTPANIMRRSKGGRVVLVDFGAAREFLPDAVQRQTEGGTEGYGAPEQYYPEARRGRFTDVFGLAGTLYCLLTGRPPLDWKQRLLNQRFLNQRLVPPGELVPSIPAHVSRAVVKALELEATKRPQTVREFLALFPPTVPPKPVVAPRPRSRRRPWMGGTITAAAAALLASVLVAGY